MRAAAMDARSGEDMRPDQIGERRKDCGAGADIVGKRGQRQIHALARKGLTLAVEREREFGINTARAQCRCFTPPPAGRHPGRRHTRMYSRNWPKLQACHENVLK